LDALLMYMLELECSVYVSMGAWMFCLCICKYLVTLSVWIICLCKNFKSLDALFM
jgi:hypothetical protein